MRGYDITLKQVPHLETLNRIEWFLIHPCSSRSCKTAGHEGLKNQS